jgi:hypothetical protein
MKNADCATLVVEALAEMSHHDQLSRSLQRDGEVVLGVVDEIQILEIYK